GHGRRLPRPWHYAGSGINLRLVGRPAPGRRVPSDPTRGDRMKIYFSPASPFVRKCMVVAHETGQAGLIEKLPSAAHPVNRDRVIIARSEEHTSELQSRENLVCRLLLEK